MLVRIPYGRSSISAEIRARNYLGEFRPDYLSPGAGQVEIISRAMDNPVTCRRLEEIAVGKKTAVIVINDVTRPTPSRLLLDSILRRLADAGINDEHITILIATGNHRANTDEEIVQMLGADIPRKYRVENHVAGDDSMHVVLGQTPRGVPILVDRRAVEADLKILTGTIRPHQSAGFSGGRKSILPGIASVRSIRVHHSFPILPLHPLLGKMEGNPFHEEALAGAKMVGIDFIVNVIEDEDHNLLSCVAGDLEAAHQAGVAECRKYCEVDIPTCPDVVIASPGGYPKDINLHQAQKALATSEIMTRPGGCIILAAECADGAGDIPTWFSSAETPLAVIDRFKKDGWSPKVHAKPFLIARPLSTHNVILVSKNIDAEVLRSMFIHPAANLTEAMDIAESIVGAEASVAVLPYANDLLPRFVQQE